MTAALSRRTFVARLAASAAVMLGGCVHRNSDRPARIGFMIGEGYPAFVAAFEGELRRLGYETGHNLVLENRFTRSPGDLQRQARELAALNLDVIVAGALPFALELKSIGTSTPVVVATTPGLVANGLAQSMERPGGNFTGLDELPPGLTGRRLSLLHSAAPQLRKIALLSTTPGTISHQLQLEDAERAAAELGLTVRSYRAASRDQLEPALAALAADGMEGLVNFQGGLSLTNRDLIIDFVRRHRLPAIYQSKLFVDSGGLMAYSPDQEEQFREAARLADRIVRGARPGELPIVYPGRYYLSVNLRAAAEIGLSLPPSLLDQADFRID